jgi:predicted PurR-regulated permease PerM
MWVTALNVVTLLSMIAVLGYALRSAQRLEKALTALFDEQAERLRRMERDLDRVRQSLESVSTGVMAIDIRQRIKKTGN